MSIATASITVPKTDITTLYLPTYNQVGLFMITVEDSSGNSQMSGIVQSSSNNTNCKAAVFTDPGFSISSSNPNTADSANPIYINVYTNATSSFYGIQAILSTNVDTILNCTYVGTGTISGWTGTNPNPNP